MLSEGLVILACVSGKGCSPTSERYLETHVDFKQALEHESARMRKFLPEFIVTYAGPMLLLANRQQATLRLTGSTILEVSNEKQFIRYNYDF